MNPVRRHSLRGITECIILYRQSRSHQWKRITRKKKEHYSADGRDVDIPEKRITSQREYRMEPGAGEKRSRKRIIAEEAPVEFTIYHAGVKSKKLRKSELYKEFHCRREGLLRLFFLLSNRHAKEVSTSIDSTTMMTSGLFRVARRFNVFLSRTYRSSFASFNRRVKKFIGTRNIEKISNYNRQSVSRSVIRNNRNICNYRTERRSEFVNASLNRFIDFPRTTRRQINVKDF